MKLLNDPLTRTMLQNLHYLMSIIISNLESNGTIDGNYGKRSANPGEEKVVGEMLLSHPERAMEYTAMTSDPKKKMAALLTRMISKIFVYMRYLGFGKFSSDERTIAKLKEMRDVMGTSLNAYRGPIAEFICDSDHAPQVLALMHYFLDTKSGREAALYVKGFEYAHFIRMPSLSSLTEEFPHIGPKSTLNDSFAGTRVTPFTKEEIQNAAAAICQHKLSSEIIHRDVSYTD